MNGQRRKLQFACLLLPAYTTSIVGERVKDHWKSWVNVFGAILFGNSIFNKLENSTKINKTPK